jgi:hypothetical protein
MMKKFTEEYDDSDVQDMEAAGIEAIVEIFKEQQATQREIIEMFQVVGMALVEAIREDNAESRKIRRQELQLERQRHKDSITYRAIESQRQSTRKCESAKDLSKLSEVALAAKSGASTKQQTKTRSGKGKKASQ